MRDSQNKKKQITPHNSAIHIGTVMKHMVVIVPVDADIDKAEDITNKFGQQTVQSRPAGGVRNFLVPEP